TTIRSNTFTGRVYGPGRVRRDVRRTGGAGAERSSLAEGDRARRDLAVRRVDRPGPRLQVAEVDDRGLRLGDLDANGGLIGGTFDDRQLDRGAVLRDDHGVQHVAGLDAAGPGELRRHVAAVGPGVDALDGDRVRIDRAGMGDHELASVAAAEPAAGPGVAGAGHGVIGIGR